MQRGWLGRRRRRARPAEREPQPQPGRPPAPPLGGAPVTGVQVPRTAPSRPEARPPRRRRPPPEPAALPQAAGRPPPAPSAAAPALARTHIAPQLLLGGRFPQPARAHHVAAAAHAAGRLEPAAGSTDKGAGAGGWVSRPAVRSSRGREGPGQPAAAGRGRSGAARARPPCALPLSPRAPARSPGGAAAGAPAGRAARSPRPQPAAPPGGLSSKTQTAPGVFGSQRPEAREEAGRTPPGLAFFSPRPEASRGQRGRRPRPWWEWRWGDGKGLRGLDRESIFHRGSSGRDPRAAPASYPSLSFRFQWVRFWLKLVMRFPARVPLTLSPP